MTKTIKILHLYHDLMNLYGDWANPAVLARELTARGHKAEVEKKSTGDDISFEEYNFAYIGSGTERSQRALMSDLAHRKKAFTKRLDDGMHCLITGCAHELFGQAVTASNSERYETLGLLDFETVQQHSRVTGDCICKATFLPEKLVGFINRAGGSQKGGDVERPFLHEKGPYAQCGIHTEGIHYKNAIGTYLTGPLLLRNPPLLKHLADQLCSQSEQKRDDSDVFFKYQMSAYQMALSELSARK